MDGSPFDPAPLGDSDPLRAWASQQEIDPATGALLLTDPQKAIERLIAKGVPPPGASSMAYADPAGGSDTGTLPPIFGLDGKMMGNQTTAQGQPPQSPPMPPTTTPYGPPAPIATTNPLDPTPDAEPPIPLPQPRPKEAGPGASDISASTKKKPDAAEAISDFSKSLAGVKPVQPPPVNPVGTPSVHSATSAGAPNISNLLSMIGQQNAAHSAIQTLGRLLVAGKA